jgi:hypothetical protein
LHGGSYGFVKDMAYRLHGEPNVRTMFAMAGIRCAADRAPEGRSLNDATLVLVVSPAARLAVRHQQL